MAKHFKETSGKFFLAITFLLILLGSLGIYKNAVIAISLAVNLIFLGIRLTTFKKLDFPRYFLLLTLFIAVMLIHTIFNGGKFGYFWLFLSGYLYFLSLFNLKEIAQHNFNRILILLGIFMACGFIVANRVGIKTLTPDNLILPIGSLIRHNHIGDLWSIILVSLICSYPVTKYKNWYLVTILTGLAFLFISLSRSALMSLAAGISFIYSRPKNMLRQRGLFKITFLTVIIFFIVFSLFKPTIFARPYYAEALLAFIKNPLGVGMGNFNSISLETNNAHNLIFELVGGVGLFAFIFIFWLFLTARHIFNRQNKLKLVQVVFIAILTNFLFDSTYVIPGMFWLWFISIALL